MRACLSRLAFSPRPVALAAALSLVGPAVLAQADPADSAVTVAEPVLVTGSVRALRALELPFAITSIDSSALRAAGPMVNLSEALARVPGLVANNRNNYAQDLQISSRGFGARAGFGVRGLRMYTDGIPATMPDGQGQVAHVDLAGAQRIEVLRGPFSVLYGNASGGVIAVLSAPVTAAQSEVALDAGSFGLGQARVTVAAPLGHGFDLRASYTHLDLDGFRPQAAAKRSLGNVRLGWQGGDDNVTVLLSDHTQAAQDPLGLTAQQFADDPRQTTAQASQFDTRKTIRQTQAGVNWRHVFDNSGPLRSSSLTVYDGSRGVTQFQSIPASTQGAALTGSSGGGVVDFDRSYRGVEGKLSWQIGAADLVTGVVYETQRDERRGYENFSGTVAKPVYGMLGRLRRDEQNDATSRDAFVQLQLPLVGDLVLTGGLRSGRVTMRTDDHYLANGDDSGRLSYNYTNPVLGLRWLLQPGWSLHASGARGFESPTLGELAYKASGGGGFNASLKGQTSQQFELGSKFRRAGVSVDAAIFSAATDNEIGVLSNSGGRSVYQNVGRTQRRGLELAAGWQALPSLLLQASAGWLHAEYRDPFGTGAAAVTPGKRIAGTSAATGWAEAAWRPGVLPGELGLEWRAMARMAANDTNTAYAPGYALANLRWRGSVALGPVDAIELLARVDNLLNRVHVGSVIVNDANLRYFETGTPRSGLLSARWQHRW